MPWNTSLISEIETRWNSRSLTLPRLWRVPSFQVLREIIFFDTEFICSCWCEYYKTDSFQQDFHRQHKIRFPIFTTFFTKFDTNRATISHKIPHFAQNCTQKTDAHPPHFTMLTKTQTTHHPNSTCINVKSKHHMITPFSDNQIKPTK